MREKVILLCMVVGLTCLPAGRLGGLALAMGQTPSPNLYPEQSRGANPTPGIDFRLEDLSGKTHTLSEHKGKIVFLNFWATWCPPCREEMPSMQKLFNSWDKNKYVMLAVNIGEDKGKVSSFAKKNNYTFPILIDKDGKVAELYGVRGIPTTLLLDYNGKITRKVVGAREWKLEDLK